MTRLALLLLASCTGCGSDDGGSSGSTGKNYGQHDLASLSETCEGVTGLTAQPILDAKADQVSTVLGYVTASGSKVSPTDLVVDLTTAWGALLRRAGRAGTVVALATSGLAPWTDVPAFRVGNGAGGYLLADPGLDLPASFDGAPVEVLPADAGRWERDALAGEAVAYLAGTGPWAGFTAAEALACGTPVVALAGSPAAEVVDHGVTGLVVDSFDDVDVDELARLDRWACRKMAHDRFSAERAALDLLVLAGRPPVPATPVAPAPVGPGARPERELAPAA